MSSDWCFEDDIDDKFEGERLCLKNMATYRVLKVYGWVVNIEKYRVVYLVNQHFSCHWGKHWDKN